LAAHWDCALHAYAAARDAACWQLNIDEAGLWLTLEAFAEASSCVDRNRISKETL
jgi:hypothetical protein